MSTDLNMNTFDSEERLIQSALSRIKVDTSKLSSSVMEGISEQRVRSTRRVRRGITLVAAIVAVLAITTTALAATGGFDWIMQRINPTFAEIIEPVMVYAEDQGIRMTVIGAQNFENMAVVYISLQDVSGENRLTERASIGWNLSLRAVYEIPDSVIDTREITIVESAEPTMFSGGSTLRQIYFDEATGTLYYELTKTSNRPIANSIEVVSWHVLLDSQFIDAKPVGISLLNLDIPETVTAELGDGVFSSMGFSEKVGDEQVKLLQPGRFATLPDYPDNHWVSNIGIIDGQLRVQGMTAWDGTSFDASRVSFALLRSDGEIIHSTESLFARVDESYNLTTLGHTTVFQVEPRDVMEFIFDVDVYDLANYTLVFYGNISTGIEGEWLVQVDLAGKSNQILTITEEHLISGHTIEFITLNPLGLQARGRFPAYWTMGSQGDELEAYIETPGGTFRLRQAGGFYAPVFETWECSVPICGNFTLTWEAESLIDIEFVTAIIIGGQRIAVS